MSKMRAFVDKLHSGGRKWVPIHDSAIAKVPGYPVYDEGTKLGVWIKDKNGEPYTGQVRLVWVVGTHIGRTRAVQDCRACSCRMCI